MRKRKWYERMSAAVLIAVLLVNHGDMGIMAKAEMITALEENLEEENKKIEAETASASNADEKRDTTVDSNETTESDLEKETATASNGKEIPETKFSRHITVTLKDSILIDDLHPFSAAFPLLQHLQSPLFPAKSLVCTCMIVGKI